MDEYIFGVMSTKFKLKAPDILTAKKVMSIFFGKNLPIAIYSPIKSAFMPESVLTGEPSKEETKLIRQALSTIIEVR